MKKKFIIIRIRLNGYLIHTGTVQKTEYAGTLYEVTFPSGFLLHIINDKEGLTTQMSHSQALTVFLESILFLPPS